MFVGPLRSAAGHAVTDRLAQTFQPNPRPGKFRAQDSKTDRDAEQAGAGGNDHDDAEQNHGSADDRNDDPLRSLVGDTSSFPKHGAPVYCFLAYRKTAVCFMTAMS
jgi:hypothetical protein